MVGGGSAVETLTGNSGIATPSSNNINVVTANTTVKFVGSGASLTEDFGLSNLVLGNSATAISSALENVGLGSGCFNALSTGTGNVAVGFQACLSLSTGGGNTAIGLNAMKSVTTGTNNTVVGNGALFGAITSTSNNTAVGKNTLQGTGSDNTALGNNAGSTYIGTESSNILIGNTGTAAESNVIRIGTQGTGAGQQNTCFVAGIEGVTVSNPNLVTINTSTNQLGSVASANNSVLVTNSSGVPSFPAAPALSFGQLIWFDGSPFIGTASNFAYFYDDMYTSANWQDNSSGGSSGIVGSGMTSQGAFQVRSQSSSTGYGSFYMIGTGFSTIGLPTGQMYFETKVEGDQIGTVGDQFNLFFGFHDCNTSGVISNGIYFSYVYATDTTHWIINCTNNSSTTSTTTSVVANPSGATLAFLYTSSVPNVVFYINGVSVGTITTNLPTNNTAVHYSMKKTVGTTNIGWNADWVTVITKFTSSR